MPLFLAPPPAPAIISNEVANGVGANSTTLAANTVYLYAFEVFTPVTIVAAGWRMGATTTGTTNMGVYTFAGNLVSGSDTGAITNTTNGNMKTTYGSTFTLQAGQYFMALGCSNNTDTYLAKANLTTATWRGRTAANGLSGAPLQSTTGALSTVATQVDCCLFVQGGLT